MSEIDSSKFNSIQAATSLGNMNSASKKDISGWYEAMADAWGDALDNQAARITELSDAISTGGQDNPKTMTLLSAESMRMQFLSNNASTSTSSVGQALETLAKKQ